MLLIYNSHIGPMNITTSDFAVIPRVGDKILLGFSPHSEVKSVFWHYRQITPDYMPSNKSSEDIQVVINCE